MRKIFFIVCFFSFLSGYAQQVYTSSGKPAQAKKKTKSGNGKGFDFSRIVFGGGLGLGFGSQTSSFSISPIVGYRFLDNLAAGVGLGYQYYRYKDYFQIPDAHGYINLYDLKSSITAPSIWVRYVAFEKLLVHAEFEYNFMRYQNYRFASNGSGHIESYKEKYNVPAMPIGIGLRQAISENASFYFILMYDLYNQIDPSRQISVYGTSIFPRIGFNVGF